MDDKRLAVADLEVLKAAETGEGCIEITSMDQLMELAKAANATKSAFDEDFSQMTAEQAAFARGLRCDQDYSWRAVAEACCDAWHGDWGSNQLAGMAICERAASFYGEDYMLAPWN